MAWTLKNDGWHHEPGPGGTVLGGRHVDFSVTPPPMRDEGGRPCRANGNLDARRWMDEVDDCGGFKDWLDRIRSIYGI